MSQNVFSIRHYTKPSTFLRERKTNTLINLMCRTAPDLLIRPLSRQRHKMLATYGAQCTRATTLMGPMGRLVLGYRMIGIPKEYE